MRLGEMKHRIQIQKPVRVPDGMGGFSESWESVANVRCKAHDVASREFYQQKKEKSERVKEFRFRVRECPVLGMDYRIVLNGENFDISSTDTVDDEQTWLVRGKLVV